MDHYELYNALLELRASQKLMEDLKHRYADARNHRKRKAKAEALDAILDLKRRVWAAEDRADEILARMQGYPPSV